MNQTLSLFDSVPNMGTKIEQRAMFCTMTRDGGTPPGLSETPARIRDLTPPQNFQI